MNTTIDNTNPLCGCTDCTCQPCNCVSPAQAVPMACGGDDCSCDAGDQGCLCQ